MTGPRPEWCERTCVVCPAQKFGPGQFDVVDRPGPQFAYRPEVGWRVAPDGTAVCVHPYRVGLSPGRYASAGEPVPAVPVEVQPSAAALQLPDDLVDLEGWLVAVLRVAAPQEMFAAVARVERLASERFASKDVVAAIRRVLSVELASR